MSQLSLFPLSNPLFPGQRLSLQIFEPRYLSLVSRCLKNNETFGVVQIREGREVGQPPLIFQFGVEARIVDFNQLDNGLLGIAIEGARKFVVEATCIEDDTSMSASVRWLEEERIAPIPDRFDGLVELLVQLQQHPAVSVLKLGDAQNSRDLGWQLCQLLPLSAADKVALLSLDDPELRLEHIAERVSRLSED
ncbi:MAG: LON peptidase substrate-binding domain-containing protein [Cellvibrionaceae bacterium]